ncbi:MAG: hypothetical protein P1P89_19700 [Desulfobacterales bacterium]|nr:hypothetical protein [Desulfobacterales bacterium]
MRVRSITSLGDWTFGKGKANYLTTSKAIAQNVKTRLRSFLGDWYLDTGHGVDWLNLLGNRGTERRIVRAVEKTVLQTEGIVTVSRIEIIRRDRNRGVAIEVDYTDVFNAQQQTIEVPA